MGGGGDWYSLDSNDGRSSRNHTPQASCWALPGLDVGTIAEIFRSYLYANIDHQV